MLGFALAELTAKLLALIHLPLPVPVVLHIEPDWRVAAYAAAVAIFAALACGLLPALQCVKESIAPYLHRERRMRFRQVLVTAQVAISVIVLTSALLFLRNLAGANAPPAPVSTRQSHPFAPT